MAKHYSGWIHGRQERLTEDEGGTDSAGPGCDHGTVSPQLRQAEPTPFQESALLFYIREIPGRMVRWPHATTGRCFGIMSNKRHPKSAQTNLIEAATQNGAADSAKRDSVPDESASHVAEWHYRIEQLRLASKLNVITAIAAGAAIVYAFITFMQFRDAHRNFTVTERAWIKPTIRFGGLEEGKAVGSDVVLDNVGKTPAFDITVQAVTKQVPADDSPSFEYETEHVNETTGMIFEGARTDIPAFIRDPSAPGLTPRNLSHDEYTRLVAGDVYLVTYLEVTYRDIFGVEHWLHFCSWHSFKTGKAYKAAECTDYNATDNN